MESKQERRLFKFDVFGKLLRDHYDIHNSDLNMSFSDSDSFSEFTVHQRDKSWSRSFNTEEALDEIGRILFPGESVIVTSMFYKTGWIELTVQLK